MKTKMPLRVARSVQRTQADHRLAFERDHVVVFNQTIDVYVFQCFSSSRVRRDRDVAAEMFLQRVHPTHVIRMQMREYDLAHAAAFTDHVVDTFSQRLLLVFVRRPGIEDEHLLRVVNDVTARVRRWWTCRRAHWKADVIRTKRNASRWFAIRLRYRQ